MSGSWPQAEGRLGCLDSGVVKWGHDLLGRVHTPYRVCTVFFFLQIVVVVFLLLDVGRAFFFNFWPPTYLFARKPIDFDCDPLFRVPLLVASRPPRIRWWRFPVTEMLPSSAELGRRITGFSLPNFDWLAVVMAVITGYGAINGDGRALLTSARTTLIKNDCHRRNASQLFGLVSFNRAQLLLVSIVLPSFFLAHFFLPSFDVDVPLNSLKLSDFVCSWRFFGRNKKKSSWISLNKLEVLVNWKSFIWFYWVFTSCFGGNLFAAVFKDSIHSSTFY